MVGCARKAKRRGGQPNQPRGKAYKNAATALLGSDCVEGVYTNQCLQITKVMLQ